jgi:protein-L-isoaspartate(D-aspartate) O-methyltransferase
MDRETELSTVRRAYAKQIMAAGHVSHPGVESAFASVRREDFLGPGPWPIARWRPDNPQYYELTPDDDPVFLYSNDLVGIIPERGLNNGQPSLHAALIAAANPRAGEHVVHIGAGVGYYTAIMATLVGPSGEVTAIEIDAELARRTEANFSEWPQVRVVQGDGTAIKFDTADVVYVNAGATRPADMWLDQLADGGRLLLPLSSNEGFDVTKLRDGRPRGGVFLIQRSGIDFATRMISVVAIIPCEGARDQVSEQALAAAFAKGGWEKVTRLYRGNDIPEEGCWLRAPGWCLAYE